MKRVVIVPTDPLNTYDLKGTSEVVRRVYNPDNYFEEVVIVSPFENKDFVWQGYKVYAAPKYVDFKQKLKLINPDFVRVYGSYTSCTFSIFARLRKYPVIVSIHDDRDSFIHSSIRYADHIFAVSDLLKNILINKGVNPSKINVIGNRIDYDTFKPLKNQNHLDNSTRHNHKTILHIGKKTKQKNLDNVIRALQYLPENVLLKAVGVGDDEVYMDIVKELNLIGKVQFIQSIPNNKLNKLYNECDVFCVPSRNEGFGVVFIEAAAACAKIVTSDKKPMNDILPNKYKNVFLVKDYESPRAIGVALNEALSLSRIECREDALELRSIHKRKYSFEAVDKKEIMLYSELFTKPRQTPFILFLMSSIYSFKVKLAKKLNQLNLGI
ncbi:hypothetical protein BST91_07995 [Nonlabens tegetincola]|uniref:glycosyltransferase family 4 protein n=1 Tax=Nonlabens tegetincola TaxID=323273 RepID=UPI000A203800|nr:glycosyltransferase family 4 protein [Nonlabens tegetincola]ARN71586.1 hypothetical protein BST91_07995 [Nonlabens tegetincola]